MAARSGNYTFGHGQATLKSHGTRTVYSHAAFMIPLIKSTDKVLDVGCGPGSITLDFAGLASQGHVTGIDMSQDAIAGAQKRCVERKTTNCEFRAGNIMELDVPDNTYDVVCAHQTLLHVDDPVRALREMRRVCKEGGIVAARDGTVPSLPTDLGLTLLNSCPPGDFGSIIVYPANPQLAKSMAAMAALIQGAGGQPNAARRQFAWALQAGFTTDQIHAGGGTETYVTKEARRVFGTNTGARMSVSDMARRFVKLGLMTEDDLVANAQAWKAFVDAEDAYYGCLHGELVCRK